MPRLEHCEQIDLKALMQISEKKFIQYCIRKNGDRCDIFFIPFPGSILEIRKMFMHAFLLDDNNIIIIISENIVEIIKKYNKYLSHGIITRYMLADGSIDITENIPRKEAAQEELELLKLDISNGKKSVSLLEYINFKIEYLKDEIAYLECKKKHLEEKKDLESELYFWEEAKLNIEITNLI